MLSAGDVVDVHVASERNDGYLATRRGDHVQVLAWEGECPYGYRVCRGRHGPRGWLDAGGALKSLESSGLFEVLVSAERLDGYLATRKGDKVEILHVVAEWVYAKRLDDAVEGWVATNTLNPVTTVSDAALQAVADGQPTLARQKQEAARNEANADKAQEVPPCTVNVAQALYPDHAGNLITNEESIKFICEEAGIPEIKKGDIWRSFPKAGGPVAVEYTKPSPYGHRVAQVPYNHVLTAAIDVLFVRIEGDPGVAIKVYRPHQFVWINVFRYNRKHCKADMFLCHVKHQVLLDDTVQIPEPKIEMPTSDSTVQGTYTKVPVNDGHEKEVFWCADTKKLVYGDGLSVNYEPSRPLKPGWVPIWTEDMSCRYFVNQVLDTSTWIPPYAAIPEYTPNQLREMGPRAVAVDALIKM